MLTLVVSASCRQASTAAGLLLVIACTSLASAAEDANSPKPTTQALDAAPNAVVAPKPAANNAKRRGDIDGHTIENQVWTFALFVVGPERQPVPNAHVEIRTNPAPTRDQITRGSFERKGSYGTFAKSDADGRLEIKLDQTPTRFVINITTPGFGPYWASWASDERSQVIPTGFTAELESAWTVGAVIQDGDGNAVTGATIRPSIEFKKRPGDHSQLGVGTNLTTDADGRWQFASVPASKSELFVEISHPEFMPLRLAAASRSSRTRCLQPRSFWTGD